MARRSGHSGSKIVFYIVLVSVLLMIQNVTGGGPKKKARLVTKPESSRIKGQYMVILNKGVDIDSFIDGFPGLRGLIRHRFTKLFNGFSGEIPKGILDKLMDSDDVDFVEEDGEVKPSGIPWGLDRIDQRTRYLDNVKNYPGDGSGVHIYVLDTGVRGSHSQFSGRMANGYDAYNTEGKGDTDCNGHGTHCAGTAAGANYGVAPGATIHGVRVLNCYGVGADSAVAAGMEWVLIHKESPAVVSMSLGRPGYSDVAARAMEKLNAAGVVVVVAAGNDNANACGYMLGGSQYASAINVGATNKYDTRASFSNYGTCVDIFAPGVDIISAGHATDSATATKSGTSMACPHVAGAAAVLLSVNMNMTPAEVTSKLISTSTQGIINDARYSPNRLLYLS